MDIRKQVLTSMHRCYACAPLAVGGQWGVQFATEGEGPCLRFTGPDFTRVETVWDGPGGTMTMVPLPGRVDGAFLAVQRFFRMFQWEEAGLALACPPATPGGPWRVRGLCTLPYVHRFDVLTGADGVHYLVAATLAGNKASKDDWSSPGRLLWARLHEDAGGPLTFAALGEGITQNHGYWRGMWQGRMSGFFSGREGIFVVTPPEGRGGAWRVERLLDVPVSDLALADIDGDGEDELATLEPFHGNLLRVWKRVHGAFVPVYEHPDRSDFYHAVWGGMLGGAPAFLAGCRRGTQALYLIRAGATEPLSLTSTTLDSGGGPSNVAVLHARDSGLDHDIVLAANREAGEAVLYHFPAHTCPEQKGGGHA